MQESNYNDISICVFLKNETNNVVFFYRNYQRRELYN